MAPGIVFGNGDVFFLRVLVGLFFDFSGFFIVSGVATPYRARRAARGSLSGLYRSSRLNLFIGFFLLDR
jgi:hypothetical protein